MGRRTILLIAALVVAALGTILVFLYAQNANDRAQADQDPVQVLVAKADVNAGTTGQGAQDAGAFELKTVTKGSVAPGALSTVTPIANQVALAPIFVGQQILSQQFGASASATSSLPIPKGKLAISVRLGDPERVAGFVQPGSNVAVFVTVAGGANTQADAVRVLIPRVQVIAVGPTTVVSQVSQDDSGNTNTEELPKALLTLAVDQTQASKVILAQQKGAIYFGLLTNTSVVTPGAGVAVGSLTR